ncbi:hypothetical protein ACWDOR_23830 [Streptosporangium canum]
MPETPLKQAAQQLVAAGLAGLTPEGRTQRTAAARAQGPGALEYWLRKVDPDELLDEDERARLAGEAKTAYFRRIATGQRRRRAGTGKAGEANAA